VLILDPSVTPYYSNKDYLKPFGQWDEHVLPDVRTPGEMLAKLDQLHISHVLDVNSSDYGFRVPQNYPGLVLIFDQPDERVYQVKASSPQ
jgi:hypothetical protein